MRTRIGDLDLARIGSETEPCLRPRSDGDGRQAPTCDGYRAALPTAQRHLYGPRRHRRRTPPTAAAALPLRQSEACPRSGLRALAQDDDQRAARLPPSRLPPSSTNAVVRARHDNALARRPAQERSTTDTASPPTDRARDTATARRRPGRRPVSQGTITSRFPRRSVRCHAASIWLSGMVTRLKSSSRSRAHWTTWAYARPIVSPSMPLVAP